MTGYLAVALGGAIGAMGRHLVNGLALRLMGPALPWGTLAVNILGSFAMGVLIGTLARHFSVSNDVRLFLATGILGGFTTFSAFSLDTVAMAERGATVTALAYVAASVVFSIAALFAGLWAVRTIG